MNSIFQNQLFQLTSAHFKEIIREPGVIFWGILFPILMSLGLGIAFTKKADTIRKVAYISESKLGQADSVSFMSKFLEDNAEKIENKSSKLFFYKITIPDNKLGNATYFIQEMKWADAVVGLKRGSLNVILTEKNNRVEYNFDPANPDAQLTYLMLSRVFENREVFNRENDHNIKPLTLKGTRYIDFLIPGLIAMGIMMSSMWGLSYGIIEKRSKKLLRRMIATPMKKSGFLIGLITVRLGMNLIEAFLLFLFAYFVFDIQIQGSIPALFAIFIAGNIAFAGIAIFISSRTAKTEIGNGLINFIVFPMMLLSGIFFSYHNFPDKIVPIIQKIPLTLVADGMRSIFIEGAGFSQVAIPFMILSIIGTIFFSAGLKLFKWY
jgi:ABC-type multidrug transport system permease subunit